jgi:hypothetical protein
MSFCVIEHLLFLKIPLKGMLPIMPSSFMTLFPNVLSGLEAMKIPLQTSVDLTETTIRCQSLGFDLMKNSQDLVAD